MTRIFLIYISVTQYLGKTNTFACAKGQIPFRVIMACYSRANHIYAFPLCQSKRPCGVIFTSVVHFKFSDLSECCEKFRSEFQFIVSSHEFTFKFYEHYFVSKYNVANSTWSKISRSKHGCHRTNRLFGSAAEKLMQTKAHCFLWQQGHSSEPA